MIIYYLIFITISLLAYKEIYKPKPLNIYSFIFLTILLSIFIGLRNEIGCDWAGYKKIFMQTNCVPNIGNKNLCDTSFILRTNDFGSIIDYLRFKEVGYSLVNLLTRSIGGNFYLANYFSSLLFILPLLYFCTNLKRPFLAILVSYPYLITVIGLGTIRQSIAISMLMISITELRNLRFYKFYLYSLSASLFHISSSIFAFLPLLLNNKKNKKIRISKKILVIVFFIFSLVFLIYDNNFISSKIAGYDNDYSEYSIVSPFLIWIMIAFPSAIILFDYKDFKKDDIHKFWRNFSIVGILMFFSVFINKVVALRLLLFFIPIKIYALSYIPEIKRFQNYTKNIYLAIIFLSLSILTIWLNFANHSYCYLPYKNLLLK